MKEHFLVFSQLLKQEQHLVLTLPLDDGLKVCLMITTLAKQTVSAALDF